MMSASCHCGAVRIEITAPPAELVECNCSVCRRYGALWAHLTRETARVTSPPGATTAYLWNDRVIEFHHCTTCGCVTHYEDVDRVPGSRVSVNARMLPPEDVAGLRVRQFDGAGELALRSGD